MIIFYNKNTGKIEGTIEGRFHSLVQLKMWIGDKTETKRIIVNWKPVKFLDEDGKEVKGKNGKMIKTHDELKKVLKGKKRLINAVFEPDHPQKKICEKLEDYPREIKKYKVNVKTERLKKYA